MERLKEFIRKLKFYLEWGDWGERNEFITDEEAYMDFYYSTDIDYSNIDCKR